MYKKIKLNKNNMLVLGLILIAVFSICLNTEFEINDELWNFSNVYKMSKGFEIYKQLNVIITPLFFYLGELLFKVFGANYFVFRIYNTIIYAMMYYLIYKLFITIKVDKKMAISYMIMILIPTAMMIVQGANYNVLAFDFVLLGIILNIKLEKNRLKNGIVQAIILYLIFMTKQNIGAFYVAGLIIVNLFGIYENKENVMVEVKSRFLNLASIAMIFILLVGVYVIYLATTENLYNAINFTILGIQEFKNNNQATSLIGIVLICLLNIVSIYFMVSKKINIKDDIKHNAEILLSFAIPMLLIVYPLCNKYHAAVAILISIILFLYIMDATFLGELVSQIKFNKIIPMGVSLGVVVFLAISIINYTKIPQKFEYNHPYYGSNINQKQVDELNQMCEYLKDKDAIIISSKANFYMNILMRSNGILDLPFRGNFGKSGEDGLINKIENSEATIVLIDNDDEFNKCFQNSERAREYIKENYKYIDEIEKFLIYEK